MKSEAIDYVLSSLVIGLLLATAAGLTWGLLVPWTTRWLGPYHVLADAAALLMLYGLGSALLLRLLLRVKPLQPGEYPMDSPVFTYWKLLTVTYRLGQGALRPFIPVFLQPVLESLFGARIGKDVALGGTIDDPFMVSVGEGTVLGNASLVSGNVIQNGSIRIGRVEIGPGCTVGANAVVMPDTTLGRGALVMGGAFVMPGTAIGEGEQWRGNPARKWIGK